MLLPYRAKNPPERRPYVTLGLIAANVLVYIPTSVYLLFIRESAVEMFAVTHNNMNPLRMLTASFLHHDPLHLLGNMLFLWIFGAALEGRLGHIKFLLLYLAAACGAWLLHDITFGALHPNRAGLGASGAIMGLAGAYLFVFPFASIVCVWMFGRDADLSRRRGRYTGPLGDPLFPGFRPSVRTVVSGVGWRRPTLRISAGRRRAC